jgi:hypothetical protein
MQRQTRSASGAYFDSRIGYESLCREVSDSISWQRFAGSRLAPGCRTQRLRAEIHLLPRRRPRRSCGQADCARPCVDQGHIQSVVEQVVERFPVVAGGFNHHTSDLRRDQMLPQRQNLPCRGTPGHHHRRLRASAPSSPSRPAFRSTSPTSRVPGNAAPMTTPMAFCASTSRKAPTSRDGTTKRSRPSPTSSTTDHARHSAGRRPPKR